MLEFDYELAKLAVATGSGKLVTRRGLLVNVDYWNRRSEFNSFIITGKIIINKEYPMAGSWTIDGKFYSDGTDSDFDLFIEELC